MGLLRDWGAGLAAEPSAGLRHGGRPVNLRGFLVLQPSGCVGQAAGSGVGRLRR